MHRARFSSSSQGLTRTSWKCWNLTFQCFSMRPGSPQDLWHMERDLKMSADMEWYNRPGKNDVCVCRMTTLSWEKLKSVTKSDHKQCKPLSSHLKSLQGPTFSLGPMQSSPPNWGGGLVQCRTNFCVPPPHVLVHSGTGSHGVKPPSIA